MQCAEKHVRANRGQRAQRAALSIPLAYPVMLAAAHAADPASVQDQSSGPDQLQQVTVEARFVREDVQKTPISMSVITEDDIAQRGLQQVSDVSWSVPNVQFQPSGAAYGRSITAYIRGVGQQDSSFAFSPAVGFYIDGVFIGTLLGSNVALADVASVDVLRGPQGTLFGANTESGAVVIRTIKPQGDDSGYVYMGYGSYNHIQARGAFDTAIIPDTLFLRASILTDRQDGYQQVYDFVCLYPSQSGTLLPTGSSANGCKTETLGGTNMSGGRLALRWLAAENLELNLSGDVLVDTSETPATTLIAVNPSSLAPYNAFILPRFGGVQLDDRFLPPNTYTSYATFTDPIGGVRFDPITPLYGYDGALNVDWSPASDLHVKSITAYRTQHGSEPFDNVPAPLTTGNNNEWTWQHQWSQELNVTGKTLAGRLDWTAGLFYYYSDGALLGDIILPGIPIAPPELVGLRIQPFEDAKMTQKSAFLHGIFHITDQLGLELGIRYTHESQKWLEHQPLINFGPNLIFPPGTLTFPDKTTVSTNSRGDPKAGLQYQWTPDFMTYVSYATGFKSGGVNPYANISETQEAPFGPEVVKSFEIGAKSEFFSHRLRVNGAVFRMDYDGLQQTASPPGGIPLTENVGSARIDGAELEIEARPLSTLLINASGGYTDYRTVSCGLACQSPTNPDGTPPNGIAPYTPKWTANAGVQYGIALGSFGSLTPRVDYNFQSDIFTDLPNKPIGVIPAYGLLNVHLTWEGPKGAWWAQLGITNATDREYFLNKYPSYDSLGVLTGTPGAPREVLFSVRRNFPPESPK